MAHVAAFHNSWSSQWCMCVRKISRSLRLIYCPFFVFQYHCCHVKALRKVGYILQSMFVVKSDDLASNCFISWQSIVSITTTNLWRINRQTHSTSKIKSNWALKQCFWPGTYQYSGRLVLRPRRRRGQCWVHRRRAYRTWSLEISCGCTKTEGPISTSTSLTSCSGNYFRAILHYKCIASFPLHGYAIAKVHATKIIASAVSN